MTKDFIRYQMVRWWDINEDERFGGLIKWLVKKDKIFALVVDSDGSVHKVEYTELQLTCSEFLFNVEY